MFFVNGIIITATSTVLLLEILAKCCSVATSYDGVNIIMGPKTLKIFGVESFGTSKLTERRNWQH